MTSGTRKRTSADYFESPATYETKLVAFFDFLGWRSKIDEAGEHGARLIAMMVRATALAGRQATRDERVTTFSDNVVISRQMTERTLFDLIYRLGNAQIHAAAMGFYIRGGMALGQLVHDQFVVFGPALNRAYELESKSAIYPRIVIDTSILEFIGKDLYPLVVKDEGIYFIDAFSLPFIATAAEIQLHLKKPRFRTQHAKRHSFFTKYMSSLVDVEESDPFTSIELAYSKLTEQLSRAPDEKARSKLTWLQKRMRANLGFD